MSFNWKPIERQLLGIMKDAISLVAFLTILWLGDKLFDRYWGNDYRIFEDGPATGLRFKWLFDGSDAATVICFTVPSCLRMFGVIKEED